MARDWTLETARELLGEVRARTARAVAAVERAERQAGGPGDAVERTIRAELSRWMREMEALGVRVDGPWQVEFETEAGSFCWRWPEERLLRFRAKDGGQATPIQ